MTFGSSILPYSQITVNARSSNTHQFSTSELEQLSEYFRIIFIADSYNNAVGVDPSYTPNIKLRITAVCATGEAYEYLIYPVDLGSGFSQDIELRSGEYTQLSFSIINDGTSALSISDIQFCPESREEDIASVLQDAQDMVDDLEASINLDVRQYTDGGGQNYIDITLNVGDHRFTGTALITGNIQVSGQLSAEELYAAIGDIADLTVDHLSTNRRIAKYLAQDQTDINYIDIADEQVRFLSGEYAGTTEQARNPYHVPLYWEQQVWEVEGEELAPGVSLDLAGDGYPYYHGVRIFTTTSVTAYPVMVYSYNTLTKAALMFHHDGTDYVPVFVMGAGDEQGTNFFTLSKSRNGMDLLYTAATGRKVGLQGTTDGYLDPIGFREVTVLDFSQYSAGTVRVEVEGGLEYAYTVTFNEQGMPIRIKRKRGTVEVII